MEGERARTGRYSGLSLSQLTNGANVILAHTHTFSRNWGMGDGLVP